MAVIRMDVLSATGLWWWHQQVTRQLHFEFYLDDRKKNAAERAYKHKLLYTEVTEYETLKK